MLTRSQSGPKLGILLNPSHYNSFGFREEGRSEEGRWWAGLGHALSRLPCENVENLVAGPGEDKFADHPQPPSDRPPVENIRCCSEG